MICLTAHIQYTFIRNATLPLIHTSILSKPTFIKTFKIYTSYYDIHVCGMMSLRQIYSYYQVERKFWEILDQIVSRIFIRYRSTSCISIGAHDFRFRGGSIRLGSLSINATRGLTKGGGIEGSLPQTFTHAVRVCKFT